jgi:hypothetical protein
MNTRSQTPSAHSHVLFAHTKLKTKKTLTPHKELVKHLKEAIGLLQKIDPEMAIYLFTDDDNYSYAIMNANQLLILQSDLRKYFHNICPGSVKFPDVWMEMKIGVNVDPKTLILDGHAMLKIKMEGSLFCKDIAAAYTKETFMLMDSYPSMDAKATEDRI